MSYLMDYGPDWPPTPEPAEKRADVEHEPMTLGQKCLAATIAYGLVWAFFALLLIARGPIVQRIDVPTTTSTSSPHVAK